jgi:hypothetical protein
MILFSQKLQSRLNTNYTVIVIKLFFTKFYFVWIGNSRWPTSQSFIIDPNGNMNKRLFVRNYKLAGPS